MQRILEVNGLNVKISTGERWHGNDALMYRSDFSADLPARRIKKTPVLFNRAEIFSADDRAQ